MRNAKPAALIRMDNAQKVSRLEIEERAAREPQPERGDLTPPDYLDERQREKFERYAGQLDRIGLLKEVDVDCLGRYLVAHDLYISYSQAAESLAGRGEVDKADRFARWAEKAFTQAQRSAESLGMTCTSRARMAVPRAVTALEDDDL